MTRRRTTRRNRRRRNCAIAAAAAVIALVLFINWGLLPFIVAGVIAAAFYSARWYRANHPAAVRPAQNRRAAPQRPQDDEWAITPTRLRPAASDARARRNGWAPPASTNLRAVPISAECATDEHVFCPAAGCGCPCSHDPKVIAAINAARYASSTTAPPIAEDDDTPIPF
jgi:hypothetical protein